MNKYADKRQLIQL